MDFRAVALVVVVFAAAFWLGPYQTMLATSNRLAAKRFHDFVKEVDFPFYSPRRLIIAGTGIVGTVGVYASLGAHLLVPIFIFVALVALFVSDFAYIERVAKTR